MDKNMIYEKTDNFYNQKIHVTTIREPRFNFFSNICRDKKIMHIGCADAMAFKEDSNLHICLSKLESPTVLHGLDIDTDTISKLSEICPGKYFTSYDQVTEDYDIVLIPEVMEHVPNVNLFLKDVLSIVSKEYLFTVPSILAAQIFCDDCFTLEMIHPDHKYWFSPYTLYNTIQSYSSDYDMQMYYLENKSQIGVRLWKKPIEIIEEKINDDVEEQTNNEAEESINIDEQEHISE